MSDHDNAEALENHTCPDCGREHTHRFSWDWGKFWQGKVSNKLFAWIVYMTLQFIALLSGIIPEAAVNTLLWVSAVVTFIFMLAGAIDTAVGNMKITAEFKAGVLKELKESLGR